MLNEKSWYWHDRPGGLTELFGVGETRIAKSDAVALVPEPNTDLFDAIQGPLKGYWHRQDVKLLGNVQVLARYRTRTESGQSDGAPAVTQNRFGQGCAILFGTHFDIAARDPEAVEHRRVFANLARMAQVERPFRVDGGPLLDGHLLSREGQLQTGPWLFILINHGPEAAAAQVRIPGIRQTVTITDLFAGELVTATSGADGLRFEMPLDGYDSTALLIRES
jgi:hypothetical protein